MLRLASKKARDSEFERAKMGAVIAKNGRVLSVGNNSVRYYRDPKGLKVSRVWDNSLHAEQAAILKLLNSRRQDELVGATIFVSRVRKTGLPGLAKPCKICSELIEAVGIKKVVYTTNDGTEEYFV